MPLPPSDPISVTIISPPDFSAVASNGTFRAYGYVDPTTAVQRQAWVHGAGIGPIIGTPIIPPRAPYDWEFEFIGVPLGVWVTVSVSAKHPVSQDIGAHTHSVICVAPQPVADAPAARKGKARAKAKPKPRGKKK